MLDGKIVLPKNIFTEELGMEKSCLYKIIYDFNSSKLINEFFKIEENSFIRRIWPFALQATKKDYFYKSEQEKGSDVKVKVENATLNKISRSLEQLAWNMINVFKMEMPKAWIDRYPPINHKKNSRARPAPKAN